MKLGIDPGISGAIAILKDNEPVAVHDMPIMQQGKGKQVNVNLLATILEAYSNATVVLEKVHAMPGQGVSSVFRFGESFGAIKGVVAALRMPLIEVTPQAWKKKAGLIGKEKDECRTLCIQQFPHLADDLRYKKHCGRADAIMIARHGV